MPAMPAAYDDVLSNLKQAPHTWLVTGAAGLIGSHLLELLLSLDQTVIGLDNFSTGNRKNIEQVYQIVGERRRQLLSLVDGDIRDLTLCRKLMRGVNIVLHQAALGSVPRSVDDPISTHEVNLTGFLNVLTAARDEGIDRFVFASSSSVYGDQVELPQTEERVGQPLSPYALTKHANEAYAEVFKKAYGFRAIGLRYFNVFGPRQHPFGAYAAVIPRWVEAMTSGAEVIIHGDGETSRDFCYVANAVQGNVLAAVAKDDAWGEVYNIACGTRTSLNQLFAALRIALADLGVHYNRSPTFAEFRKGDVRHSEGNIAKARRLLGYQPKFSLIDGVRATLHYQFLEAER